MALDIQFDPATLQSGVQTLLQQLIATQHGLGATDTAKLQSMAATLAPMARDISFEMASGQYDESREQMYLDDILTIIQADAAALAIEGIVVEKQAVMDGIKGFATSVADALKNPTVQMLLKAAVSVAVVAI